VEDASSLPSPSVDVEVAIEDVDTEESVSNVATGVVEVFVARDDIRRGRR